MSGSPKATTNTPSSRQPARHAPRHQPRRRAAGTRHHRRPRRPATHRPPGRRKHRPGGDLPDRVRSLSDRRAHAVQSRRTAYRHWHEETQELVAERQRWIDQHIGRDRSQDQGLDDGIDL
jgi:hypothetical protein